MDEQFEFLRSIIHRLEGTNIPYMLTGSLALAVWARPRMTRDIDVVIEADRAAVARLVAACAGDCYASPEAAEQAVLDQTMFNVIHLTTFLKADFILRRDDPYERAKFDRRRTVDLDGFVASVISPEDLILSKLVWARESTSTRQTDDVRLLLRDVPSLDHDYLRRWAAALHIADALDELRPR